MTSAGKTVLIAGGAGYIGSHTAVELLNAEHRVVVIDNLSNARSNPDDTNQLPPSLLRAQQITKSDRLHFIKADINNKEQVSSVFDRYQIDTVFDFTGRKAVGESTQLPILYYKYNMNASINLLKCMREYNVRNFVYSSSCTVYGAPDDDCLPVKESAAVGCCQCPYARCKYFMECLLDDLVHGEPDYWRIIILRYFNPVGAHESGLIGEDPRGEPKNLMPKLAQVAVGKSRSIKIFGSDYATGDGTPVRDYVHIMDVAEAHRKIICKIQDIQGLSVYNIGTGLGKTAWEMVTTFERACAKTISFQLCPRRAGDVPQIYCDPSKAERELGWTATRSHEQMCQDLWRFYSLNPYGYEDVGVNGVNTDY